MLKPVHGYQLALFELLRANQSLAGTQVVITWTIQRVVIGWKIDGQGGGIYKPPKLGGAGIIHVVLYHYTPSPQKGPNTFRHARARHASDPPRSLVPSGLARSRTGPARGA